MNRVLLIVSLAVCFSTSAANTLLAQGKAPGVGRGLGTAASGATAAGKGIGRASDAIPATSSSAARPGLAVNRKETGLQRSGNAAARVRPLQPLGDGFRQPTLNQPRIADQRLQQAEHLRGLSERNGNESLLMTADRMEASALANQARPLGPAGPVAPGPPSAAQVEPNGQAETRPARVVAPDAKANGNLNSKRGLWLRSR